jgi:hypothetical protein
MTRLGLLLTLTEPPPSMEEEFNAWYDTEHLAERLSIPGFRSARRWVADLAPGEGKYLATYELDSLAVLESPQYLAHVGDNFTPWSKRCLGAAVVFRRWACEQIDPGDADPNAAARAIVFSTGDFALPQALQKRRFAASSGETVVLHELDAPHITLPSALSFPARLYRAYQP